MIYLFNGPPGSGKDAACSYFKKRGFRHLSFKHRLFLETYKFFDVSEEWFMNGYDDRSIKERYEPLLGMSRREALIYVSETVIKPNHGKDYFGQSLAKELFPGSDYCISDGGFIEELTPIINKTGVENILIFQLGRDGCDFSSDSRRYFDSEVVEEFTIRKKAEFPHNHFLPYKFPIRSYRIHNNGTLEEFLALLERIYEKEQNDTSSRENEATDFPRKSG